MERRQSAVIPRHLRSNQTNENPNSKRQKESAECSQLLPVIGKSISRENYADILHPAEDGERGLQASSQGPREGG